MYATSYKFHRTNCWETITILRGIPAKISRLPPRQIYGRSCHTVAVELSNRYIQDRYQTRPSADEVVDELDSTLLIPRYRRTFDRSCRKTSSWRGLCIRLFLSHQIAKYKEMQKQTIKDQALCHHRKHNEARNKPVGDLKEKEHHNFSLADDLKLMLSDKCRSW